MSVRPRLGGLAILRRITLLALTAYGVTAAALWWWLAPRPRLILAASEKLSLVGFSPDGRWLATVPRRAGPHPERSPGPIRFWDVATGEQVFTLLDDAEGLFEAKLAPDGQTLAVQQGCDLVVLDLKSRAEIGRLTVAPKDCCYPTDFEFAPDARTLAYAVRGNQGRYSCVRVWDVPRREQRFQLTGLSGPLVFSPSGELLLTGLEHPNTRPAATPWPPALRLWSTRTGQQISSYSDLDPSWPTGAIVFAPDGARIAFRDAVEGIKLISPVAAAEPLLLPKAMWGCFTPDGARIITLIIDKPGQTGRCMGITVWDAEAGQLLYDVYALPHTTSCAGFKVSPDGRWAGFSHTTHPSRRVAYHFWDAVETLGQRWQGLRDHGFYYTLHVFDVEGRKEVAALPGCDRFLFSPDNRCLATTCENSLSYNDGTVALWELPPGKPFGRIFGWALLVALGVIGVAGLWRRWQWLPRSQAPASPSLGTVVLEAPLRIGCH
jgi:WD40 repeat protein